MRARLRTLLASSALELTMAMLTIVFAMALLVEATGVTAAAQAIARSFFLIDNAQNAIASATAAPGGSDRGLVVREAGSLTIGTFPDNEPFNLGQVGGTSTPTSRGVTAAGVLRMAPAIDSGCGDSAVINATASGNTELVALTTDQIIYVCHFDFMSSGTADVRLVYGTGTACATGETGLTGLYPVIANVGISAGVGSHMLTKTAVSNALCIETSAAVNVRGLLTFAKF